MNITIEILLDELKYNYTMHFPSNENIKFEWVKLFHRKGPAPCAEYLQVCLLSEALEVPPNTGCYYLCLRDRIADSKETENALSGMIIINENISLFELFNHVQEIFIKINRWKIQMQESIVKNKGIQDLIDLSEPILKNHISVLDSTFKLLAHTRNIECDDPIISELLYLGYHPEKMIEKLRKFRHIEHYKQSDKVLVDRTFNISKYIALEKAFNYNNLFSLQVVMLCCQRDYSNSLRDLFDILTGYVKVYLDRKYPNKDIYSLHAALIYDLIENGKWLKKEAIIERAKYVNMPYNALFDIFKIVFPDSENTPLNRVMQEISERLITSKVIIYNQSILALNIYNGSRADLRRHREEKILKIQDIVNRHNARCGISNYFHQLTQLQTAYEQADASILLSDKISGPSSISVPDKKKNSLIFKFEDYYMYYVVDYCIDKNPEILEMDYCFTALTNLYEYDQKHNSDYLKILLMYLINEKSATQTAKQLYMHRNNIIYHISRIQELTGLELNDPEEKLKLLFAFKLFEFRLIND